jgi:hypothetical protein|tara:strand:+ start:2579 stop:3310 length:732 start_codon:yes stop_codon:yes gene_type:complete
MSTTSQKLEWCIVRLGEDMNWWVHEISDPVRWDVDGLSIVDPRQMGYVVELCAPLREYGFDTDSIERAFYTFAMDKEEKGSNIRLVRTPECHLEDEDGVLFGLPDILDEDKGPYADFLDAITKARVRLLNDQIKFEQNLTIDELEEEIRERQNADFMEGKAVHAFTDITSILEYVPLGFEIEEDDADVSSDGEDIGDLSEFNDADADAKIQEDDTMKWEEEEEDESKKEFDETVSDRPDDLDK